MATQVSRDETTPVRHHRRLAEEAAHGINEDLTVAAMIEKDPLPGSERHAHKAGAARDRARELAGQVPRRPGLETEKNAARQSNDPDEVRKALHAEGQNGGRRIGVGLPTDATSRYPSARSKQAQWTGPKAWPPGR